MVPARVKAAAKALLRARMLARSAGTAELTTSCPVAELFARHNGASGYQRLDVVAAWLAIREAEGGPDGGMALFEKMLDADPVGRNVDRVLLRTLHLGPLEAALYVPRPTPITQHMKLEGTVAGLAVALHKGWEQVPVTISIVRTELRRDAAWCRSHGLTQAEIARLEEASAEICAALGIVALPWSRIEDIRAELRGLLPPGVTLHGRGDVYQSLEPLLVAGQRPTARRFEAYGLASLLQPDDAVLDIGCNCGFLALTAAAHVRRVHGIDAAPHFIAMAHIAQRELGRTHCRFEVCKLEDFVPAEPFDVVFSFAVHHWLDLPLPEYAAKLRSLLRPGGALLLESHDLGTHDRDWEEKLAVFLAAGFEIVRRGSLCDDGLLAREHVLLRRGDA